MPAEFSCWCSRGGLGEYHNLCMHFMSNNKRMNLELEGFNEFIGSATSSFARLEVTLIRQIS